MILYYTGTGNSEYVAKKIAKEINDEAMNLFERIRNKDYSNLESETPWVIVAPTYGWRLPRLVQNYLERVNLMGSKEVYFVLTCGESMGRADLYLDKLCVKKNLHLLGCAEVVMPENFIAMFNSPSEEEALNIIKRAEKAILQIACTIMQRESLKRNASSLGGRLKSGIVNELFYKFFVHDKQFRVSDACISCGKCEKVCPLNNIQLENGKPTWHQNCTQCMACISYCPTEAIEYGKHSVGKRRYTCPNRD